MDRGLVTSAEVVAWLKSALVARCRSYPVMDDPPVSLGADQEIDTLTDVRLPVEGVAGAPGTVMPVACEAVDEYEELPALFVARTRK
jgi:hypothetical protein